MDLQRNDVSPKLKRLLRSFEVRVVVLVSLALQVVLIALAPRRKRSSNRYVVFTLWSFYLLADSVAIFAIGHLADNQSDAPTQSLDTAKAVTTSAGIAGRFDDDLLAFWAPFLLLHLGGPDTITAFSLEDNELWPRHLLALLFQLGGAAYVVVRSLPHNSLLLPTLLMLFVGTVKYLERTWSLYRGSAGVFRDQMLKELERPEKKTNNATPSPATRTETMGKTGTEEAGPKAMNEMEAVQHAHEFFHKFKVLFVDLLLRFDERTRCRNLFLELSPGEAYRVVEVELNLLYDVLYTKATLVHTRKGYTLRAACSAAIVATFLVFVFLSKKKTFPKVDVKITYTLLWGAVALDALAFAMLLYSDWTVEFLRAKGGTFVGEWLARLAPWMARQRRKRKRWAMSISKLNLFDVCLKEATAKKSLRRRCEKVWEKVEWALYIQDSPDRRKITSQLLQLVFEELCGKSREAKDMETTKKLCASKGSYVIEGMFGKDEVLLRSVQMEFDESVLLWHIATHLCYYNTSTGDDGDKDPSRELSKELSEYMLSLLVTAQELMSSVAGIGQIRYRDTCAEAKRFFREEFGYRGEGKTTVEEACGKLGSVKTDMASPSDVKGDRSKSLLFDGSILAQRLTELEVKVRWEVVAKVWVELLSYAACHCPGTAHATRLTMGGELLTVVWFLMAHLGLSKEFRS